LNSLKTHHNLNHEPMKIERNSTPMAAMIPILAGGWQAW
jgi:hypothetical protein